MDEATINAAFDRAVADMENGVDPADRMEEALGIYDYQDRIYATMLRERVERLLFGIAVLEMDDSGECDSLVANMKALMERYEETYDMMFGTHEFYETMIEEERLVSGGERDYQA